MSLLLDALKRAEQEKLARQPAGSVSAQPPPRSAAPASAPGSLELQPLAGAGATAHAAPGPARPDAAAAHSAQTVFQAKAAEPENSRGRAMLWVTVGAVAIVAIAAAAYVWYSVKSLTPQYSGAPRPRAAPTPPPASSAPLPPTTAMGSIVPAPGPVPAPPEATGAAAPGVAAPSATVPTSPAPAAAVPAPTTPQAPPESAADRLTRAATQFPAPLQMDRSSPTGRRVPAEVSAGYDALRNGDAAGARRAYQAALASDPTSVDAHLGLATLAARETNRVVAVEHYRLALDLDPRNATARAGLAALTDSSRPEALEAQLRADIDRSPESPALQFTLGNLYVSLGRWTEAQSAFFEAHRLDPGSPEIAHNLAVSLDRLGQPRLAATFYRRALESARARATPIDTAAVTRRLAEIE